MNDKIRAPQALSEWEDKVLWVISQAEIPPTYEEIAEAVGLESGRGGVGYQVDKLEEQGFVTRTPRVPRGVRMTPEGRRRVALLAAQIAQQLSQGG